MPRLKRHSAIKSFRDRKAPSPPTLSLSHIFEIKIKKNLGNKIIPVILPVRIVVDLIDFRPDTNASRPLRICNHWKRKTGHHLPSRRTFFLVTRKEKVVEVCKIYRYNEPKRERIRTRVVAAVGKTRISHDASSGNDKMTVGILLLTVPLIGCHLIWHTELPNRLWKKEWAFFKFW